MNRNFVYVYFTQTWEQHSRNGTVFFFVCLLYHFTDGKRTLKTPIYLSLGSQVSKQGMSPRGQHFSHRRSGSRNPVLPPSLWHLRPPHLSNEEVIGQFQTHGIGLQGWCRLAPPALPRGSWRAAKIRPRALADGTRGWQRLWCGGWELRDQRILMVKWTHGTRKHTHKADWPSNIKQI